MSESRPAIAIKKAEYGYSGLSGGFHLGPISHFVPLGAITFWIGPNGSGKSTLGRLLAGELQPQAGKIEGVTGRVLYHHQALEENVFPTLRVGEHLRVATGESEGARDLCRAFPELAAFARSYPDELSGGQLQLLAFASLVLRKCQVYVFDEVLNHLDRPVATRVLEWVQEHLTGSGTAVIVITHDLEAAAHYADRVAVFVEGQIRHTLRKCDIGGNPGALLSHLTSE